MVLPWYHFEIKRWSGHFLAEFFHGIADHLRDSQLAKPRVMGRYHGAWWVLVLAKTSANALDVGLATAHFS
jgi:hypothetical protein